jgi:hypothetical protein
MYGATRYTKALDYAVRSAWIAIGVIFIVELVYDIVRAIYAVGIYRLISLIIYTIIVGIGTMTIAILFLIYGQKMYRRLKLFSTNERTRQINMKKVCVFISTFSYHHFSLF